MRRDLLAATALTSSVMATLWPLSALAQTGAPYRWTGFYIGVTAGGEWEGKAAELDLPDSTGFDINFENGVPINADVPDRDYTPWRTDYDLDEFDPTGGFTAGYNYQFNRVVLGIEADFSVLGRKNRDRWTATDDFGSNESRFTSVNVYGGVENLFTVRPRVGFAATDRLLLFATGGLALGNTLIGADARLEEQYIDGAKAGFTADWSGEDHSFEVGYAVGGGAEYALSDTMSVKLEGLYYDLGKVSARIEGSGETDGGDPLTAAPFEASMQADGVIARVGLNYKF